MSRNPDHSSRQLLNETLPKRSRGGGPGGSEQGLLRALLYWSPVWILLALLAQVGILGLRPALEESRHLDHSEAALTERHLQATEALGDAQQLLRAQSDPMFLERERRLLKTPPRADDTEE